ncbi:MULTISPECIES: transcriptional regulator [unclassified Shewanella]|uniref:transcriptional regulator n=1 Tax=unclassified Shewanella TaxID=196818 RepID=UPI001BBA75D3|nr:MULTISPECIES: transcriptional regulator [unclassified Shewanella]GIU16651.1 transcriptional regulator of eicosapentaenoic acid synthesis PfaR [Shewanella sp. MBTL60-112-B1]GIU35769.1 transcriptional regulator of eicosapentaenoic acid synthesis PfaR [Shewanella sp. MBTL60-112-B2]
MAKTNSEHLEEANISSNKCTQIEHEARHRNATTTPEMRRFIQETDLSVSQLSKILNISEATVRKWRKRDSVENCPNTPHHLNTTLTPLQEYVVVGLRYQLKMPLDTLLKATQKFINPNVSRSGLARCLKRYGVSRVSDIQSPNVPMRYFNQIPVTQGSDVQTYTLHYETLAKTLALPSNDGDNVVQVVSLTIPPQLTEEIPSSILLGIDPHSDWIYLDIYQDGNTQATNRYMAYVLKHGPFHLRKLLVRNYHTFLQRFPGATPNRHTSKETHTTNNKTPDSQAPSGDS